MTKQEKRQAAALAALAITIFTALAVASIYIDKQTYNNCIAIKQAEKKPTDKCEKIKEMRD